MNTTANNLIVCCNILDRVQKQLGSGTRVQLSKQSLTFIGDYLARAIKYIDPNLNQFSMQLSVFSACIKSINELFEESDFDYITNDVKIYLTDKLDSEITYFKVNVGIYLTEHEFDYMPKMDTVLQNIIETCLSNKYYFEF